MRTATTRKKESSGRASRTRREARDSNISAAFDPSQPLQFRPIRTRRVFEEICEQVRREMGAGTLRPGDKLPAERELALQFGVSRTAVREALRSLEIAGIIGLQKGAKGGAFILKGDLDQITRSIRDLFYLGRITLDSLTEIRTPIMQTAVGLVSVEIPRERASASSRGRICGRSRSGSPRATLARCAVEKAVIRPAWPLLSGAGPKPRPPHPCAFAPRGWPAAGGRRRSVWCR